MLCFAALRAALRKRGDGTTIVLVSQRIGTVKDSERIIVLDEGRVAGVGTHAQLLSSCAVYQEIVASQEGGEETP